MPLDTKAEKNFFYEMVYRRCNDYLEEMSKTDSDYQKLLQKREELSKLLYSLLNGEDGRLSAEESSSLSEYIHSYDTLKEAYFCYKRGWLDCLVWFASA